MNLSVIIPCYNVEKFVQKCVNSILVQKAFDLEVILVNDGSKDHTQLVLERLAEKDKRIKIINQENKGLSGARNTGIAQATGEYLMFVDADDWLETNAFEVIADKFNHEDLFCFSYNRVFENKVLPRDLKINGNYEAHFIQRRMVGLIGEELADPSQADSLVTIWGKIYKTEIIKNNKIAFIETKIYGNEDAFFNIQYLEYAVGVKVINTSLYNYRKNNFLSYTNLYKPYLFQQWKALYYKISGIIANKEVDYKVALQNRIALSLIGLGINETYSDAPFYAKAKRISAILHDDAYQKAYHNLTMKYFPLHWKLYFYAAKYKYSSMVLLLAMVMNAIINKNNTSSKNQDV